MFEGVSGPELATALGSVDPEELSGEQVVDFLVGCQRVESWLAAVTARAEHTAVDKLAQGGFPDAAHVELAAALRLHPRSVGTRYGTAEFLHTTPAVAAALAAGEIHRQHLWVIAQAVAVANLDPASAAGYAAELLAVARDATPGQVRRVARRREARDRAPAVFDPPPDPYRTPRSMSWDLDTGEFTGQLHPDEMATVAAVISAYSRRRDTDDTRDVDTRRADALAELLLSRADGRPAFIPTLGLVLTPDTLTDPTAGPPADLDGVGPVTAATAGRIACTAQRIHRLLADPLTGHLLDAGRTYRLPGRDLRRYIAARDRTCRFPGCTRPAHRCEPHHVIFWWSGGPTTRTNLASLCLRHHKAIHRGGWSITGDAEHTLTFTSPTHRHYTTTPSSYPLRD